MKLSPKRFFKRNPKLVNQNGESHSCVSVGMNSGTEKRLNDRYEIEWEVRPGGMLVQKRVERRERGMIQIKVSMGYQWHDISIASTSTFGELKVLLSMVTGLWPREQRLIFRGKEREDNDHLHILGVQNKDKVLLLEDPALRERKSKTTTLAQLMGVPCKINY